MSFEMTIVLHTSKAEAAYAVRIIADALTFIDKCEKSKIKKVQTLPFKRYNSIDYPRYDNYDAIEVGSVSDIPCDYPDVMGVPITFMDKYNPDQFEIIGLTQGWDDLHSNDMYNKYKYLKQENIQK